MSGNTQQDAMIARLEGDVEERNAFVQGLVASAQDEGRSLSENERELIGNAEKIVKDASEQLDLLYSTRSSTIKARERAQLVQRELQRMRNEVDSGPVEYRSAGEYALDMYKASLGTGEAKERLEVFHRAAAHQKTGDNLGVIPDPIIGEVINFIDAARPVVNRLGPRSMPSATWHRPKVTQHASVAAQGAAGGAGDEKSELVSQKMSITRLSANAVTYGGYVNVSRQNIDFSSPQALDLVINDLAAQYAIETEAATGAVLDATANTVELDGATTADPTADALAEGLWTAAGNIYNAVKGSGALFVAVPPAKLGIWGRLFAPVNPQNSQSTGFSAGDFGSGVMGVVSGIPVLVSSGLPSGTIGVVCSTAAVEVYEQRVGALQVTEPSVLGVQVAYAGYFTPLTIEAGGIQKLVNAAA